MGADSARSSFQLPQLNKMRCDRSLPLFLQGPRLVDALEWLVGLLHGQPDLMPAGFPFELWQPAAAPVIAE